MIPFAGNVNKTQPDCFKILRSIIKEWFDFRLWGIPSKGNNNVQLKLWTGGRAVLRLSETCLPGTNLYIDWYFTGLALLEVLRGIEISETVRIMKIRSPNITFKSNAEVSAEWRGSCDTKIRDDEKILTWKLVGNKLIILALTLHGEKSFTPATRYSRADRQYVQVQMANLDSQYNLNMDGVDLHSKMLAHYCSYHRTKKWFHGPIFWTWHVSIVG